MVPSRTTLGLEKARSKNSFVCSTHSFEGLPRFQPVYIHSRSGIDEFCYTNVGQRYELAAM